LSFSADLKKQLFIKAQNLVPQHQLSRVIGKVAASENVLVKTAVIQAFKAKYGIDMSIAEQTNPNQYKSFNEFFTRALKQGVRGVDEQADSIVCPADGAISQLGKIEAGDIFQAKGQSFSVEKLIGDPQLAKPFIDGQFATVYLSPKDYHRVHMPLAGTLTETYIFQVSCSQSTKPLLKMYQVCLRVMSVWCVCLILNLVVWRWS
jgi:phosphatidylserine decarboxylase